MDLLAGGFLHTHRCNRYLDHSGPRVPRKPVGTLSKSAKPSPGVLRCGRVVVGGGVQSQGLRSKLLCWPDLGGPLGRSARAAAPASLCLPPYQNAADR